MFGIEISGNANACCAVDGCRLGCDGIVGAKAAAWWRLQMQRAVDRERDRVMMMLS